LLQSYKGEDSFGAAAPWEKRELSIATKKTARTTHEKKDPLRIFSRESGVRGSNAHVQCATSHKPNLFSGLIS
jgi:hypothetical protein